MQCEEEVSSAASRTLGHDERAVELLTKQCAQNISGATGFAGWQADVVQKWERKKLLKRAQRMP
jgi:hypothetical protein